MRIPKLNKSSFKEIDHEPIIETIDPELLERVRYEHDIDPDNPKSFPKVVRIIKSLVRSSAEYKNLMSFLKNHRNMNNSFLYKGIQKTQDKKFTIEIHHSPFVMEDLVTIVIIKRMTNGECLKLTSIADEIMYLHYIGLVGLVPLDRTHHSLVHSENSPEVMIPLQFIDFGDFHKFYKMYKSYIPENIKAAYLYMQELSMRYENIEDTIPNYMREKHIYFQGGFSLENFEQLLDDLEK